VSAAAPHAPPGAALLDGVELEGIRQDPVRFAASVFARHGDRVRYAYGGWRTVLSRHPADLEHVARTRPENYVKAGTPDLMTLVPLLGDGLMTVDGQDWAHQRALLRPAFTRPALGDTVPRMDARVTRWLDRMAALAGTGQVVDVAEDLRLLSYEIVADALLGGELGERVEPFARHFAEMSGALSEYRPGDRETMGRYLRAQAAVDGYALEILTSPARPDGLLARFRADREAGRMTLRQVRDQMLTMLVGGAETTSQAIAWTLYLLDEHPEALGPVAREAAALGPPGAATAADVDRLEATWRVMQEAMRLYPPVWLMSRIARADDELGGVPVAAGELVVLSLYDAHRHPGFWPDPGRFDPGRFLPEAAASRSPLAYRPFSAGPRTCIGMGFARLEGPLVLARACQRLRLRRVPGHPVEPEGTVVTLRPRHGLHVTVQAG
jgi:cytochrome P450